MKKNTVCTEERLRYWHAHIGAWRKSGLSAQGYARRNGLYKNSIRYWNDKFSLPPTPGAVIEGLPAILLPETPSAPMPVRPASGVKFVPVDLSAKNSGLSHPPLVLRVGSRFHIDVPDHFSQTTLARLIRTLETFA